MYVEQGIEVPFLGLLKSLLYRKQNQLLSPAPVWPLIWKRSVKAEGEAEKAWK